MNCPKCGRKIERWEARPSARQAGYCACNPLGPVVTVIGEALPDPLVAIPGISQELAAALRDRGLHDQAALKAATDEDLLDVSGIGPARLQQIRDYLGGNP